jgi:hypothetical protein
MSLRAVASSFQSVNYQGTWDASANTPTLTSSVGTKGHYYVVSVAGSTNLNGITNWGVGDWAVFNGSVWERVEGGADGNFVNLSVSGTASIDNAIISNNSANAALRITQIGAGNALLVEDSSNPDASPFVIDATGTTTIGGNPPSAGKLGVVSASGGIAIAVSDNINSSAYLRTAAGGALLGTDPGASLHLAAGGNTTSERALSVSGAQNVGIGVTAPVVGNRFQIGGTYAGSTTTRGASIGGTINPAVSTSNHTQLFITPTVSAGTLPALYYSYATQGTFTGTVTSQFGFVAESTLTGATNNYGFYANIASGAGRFNFYASGTAANVFAGTTSIGGLVGAESLRVTPVASSVNYLNATGAVTTASPSLSVAGTDTDIDLILTPKGTGVLRFGTHTAGILAQSGYITIKDAAGNTRNLLVG